MARRAAGHQRGQPSFAQLEAARHLARQLVAQRAGGKLGQHWAQLVQGAILPLGAAQIRPLEDALDVEHDERDGGLHQASQCVGPVALDQLGGVGALGQRDNAQLQLGFGRQPGRAEHRLLPGAVGVEAQHEHPDDSLELAHLLLGQRGAHDPDGVAQAGLVESEDVGVALDQDHLPGARGRRAGQVDPEQLAPLVVEVAVGGVEVLRPLVLPHRTGAEAADPPAGVG
jgi:hypothetical protein